MILADTSVWTEHLRKVHPKLRDLLLSEQVLCHPFVIGEIACGQLQNRSEIMKLLDDLPEAQVAEHEEVLKLIQDRLLFGHGIGWIDAHILASALLSNAHLWSLDGPLRRTA